MGFQNEKDHRKSPRRSSKSTTATVKWLPPPTQIQLYKLICRQVATKMGLTASFLPKPVVGVNGNGMHTNVSINKGRQESFLGCKGDEN